MAAPSSSRTRPTSSATARSPPPRAPPTRTSRVSGDSTNPPHQVFIGNRKPEALWGVERPWWRHSAVPEPEGPYGVFIDQDALYAQMEASGGLVAVSHPGRARSPRGA